MNKCFYIIIILLVSCSLSDSQICVENNSPVAKEDVLIENIGVETLGGVFTPILKVGCKLPCESSQIFSTAEDNQNQIMIVIARGMEKMAKNNVHLGKYKIQGISPAPRGAPKIKVTFKVVNGSIWLCASHLNGSSQVTLAKLE
ncbi:MAG TPA: Hsp70 family protein [Cyclobacteriaceae bacterium]|jgi:molecular chaperone DnaK|nr:Hsp70 family protein [Cyclobacteriaceae bacterium]